MSSFDAIGYVDNIITSDYTISYYDQDDLSSPAYHHTGQYISGINVTFTTNSISLTSSIDYSTSFLIPTVSSIILLSQTPPPEQTG